MQKLLLMILFVFAALMGLAVALYQWLGWLGLALAILLGPLLLLVFFKLMAGRLLEKAFMVPFKAKGAVLRDAEVRVHSVTPAPIPAFEDGEDFLPERPDEISDEDWDAMQREEDELRREHLSRRYFYVDATITPRPATGQGFTMWEPGELTLVRSEVKNVDMDDEDGIGDLRSVQIWHEGAWQDDEGLKYGGPQRIKLYLGVPPDVTQARFRYYFEVFGRLELESLSAFEDFSPNSV